MNRISDFTVGDKVRIPKGPYDYRLGGRRGEVVKIGRSYVHVKIDILNRIFVLMPESIEKI